MKMMFDDNLIPYPNLYKYKYYGRVKDKEGNIWTFYTNSMYQFKEVKENKYDGFEFVEGFRNKNYDIFVRLK